jgi:hypothetical protein
MKIETPVPLLLLCLGVFSCGNPRPHLRLLVPEGPIGRALIEHKPCPENDKNCVDIVPLPYEQLYQQIAVELFQDNDAQRTTNADLYLLDDAWVEQFRGRLKSFNLPPTLPKVQDALASRWTDGSGYWAVPLLTNLQMLFRKGVESNRDPTWTDITKMTGESKGSSPTFVLRGRSSYALTNDFLPILWAYGGDLVVVGKSARLEPDSSVLAAMHALHNLARSGPPYQELLSTDGLRLELEGRSSVVAIEWSAASHQLNVPDVKWSAIPCVSKPIHRSGNLPKEACQQAGVLSTWVLAAPGKLKGGTPDAVTGLFQWLTGLGSHDKLCALDASLTSPPVLTNCSQKPGLSYYATGPGLPISTAGWRDAGASSDPLTLLGRLRPQTPYWHEIDEFIGQSLNTVLLDLQSEEQAFANLKLKLSDFRTSVPRGL